MAAMLRQLHIKGFKSIKDAEVHLSPLVVIFGPNAAGKSNLIDGLVLLSRLVTERTLADAYSPPLRGYPAEAFSLPSGGLEGLLSQEEARQSFEALIDSTPANGSGKSPSLRRYRVEVRIRPASGDLSVSDELLERVKRDGTATQQPPRIERKDQHVVIRRTGETGQPRKEPLGAGYCMASNLQFTGSRYPDFDALRDELGSWRSYYLDPRIAMREPRPPKEVTDIGPLGELLAPFLYRLKQTQEHRRRFEAVRRAVHEAIPSIEGIDVDLDRKRGTLDLTITQDGVPFSSRVISEGTLRILALCAIAANPWPSSLVAFEEPENGVHPRRIQVVARLLWSMVKQRGHQVVVTTHSPSFVAEMIRWQQENPDVVTILRCSRELGATTLTPFDAPGPLFEDEQIRAAFTSSTEDGLMEALLRRGWLDD